MGAPSSGSGRLDNANVDQIVLSDLHRMECRVGPLSAGNSQRLAQFDAFFASADVRMVALSPTVCERAASIRATYHYRPMDALHLSAAVEHGCTLFVTNDQRLSRFSELTVEPLP
jgi:predicted nucleic acid-binding protein